MPHGGARPGAGRKKGSASARTRAIADKAAAEGITPLEVMLEAMREAYDAGELRDAAMIAERAAPYIHPRLSSVNANATIAGSMQFEIVSMFPDA
ncbi:MAG TPA: hypothetical protein VEA81_00205 [Burkholderiaceae bacterium]|nr:hypothetical protein [Burkholderiaceae bacterium]